MNQKKIKKMVKLAKFEQGIGKEDLKIMAYFKGDYIGYQTFLALLGVTVALLLFFLVDIGDKFFGDMQKFIEYDFVGIGVEYLTIWIVFMVIYGVIASIIYRKRYGESKRRVDIYQKTLKELRKL